MNKAASREKVYYDSAADRLVLTGGVWTDLLVTNLSERSEEDYYCIGWGIEGIERLGLTYIGEV